LVSPFGPLFSRFPHFFPICAPHQQIFSMLMFRLISRFLAGSSPITLISLHDLPPPVFPRIGFHCWVAVFLGEDLTKRPLSAFCPSLSDFLFTIHFFLFLQLCHMVLACSLAGAFFFFMERVDCSWIFLVFLFFFSFFTFPLFWIN